MKNTLAKPLDFVMIKESCSFAAYGLDFALYTFDSDMGCFRAVEYWFRVESKELDYAEQAKVSS